MRLKSVAIEGFRGSRYRMVLDVDPDFTILSGQNDAGKSTFLDALDIFFNGTKMAEDDFHRSEEGVLDTAYIEVTFDSLPSGVVLDSKYETSFQSEFLTDDDGELTVRHTYNGGKILKSLQARHPVLKESQRSLLALSNKELKDLAEKNSIDLSECNKSINANLRESIYQHSDMFEFRDHYELDDSLKEVKSFFPKLEKNYPVFHLFSAENVSDEGEKYIQDPVKAIVRQVIEKHKEDLDLVAAQIDKELTESLSEVSDELGRLAPTLKTSFSPHNIDAKWENAYKAVAFHDENNVPLATRGSGMRRLALLSFFRVSAKGSAAGKPVIFAVEEPEVFLHPDLQKEVWNALTELASQEGSQVLITSHSSNLIAKTHVTQVRYLRDGVVEQVGSVEDRGRVIEFVSRIEQSLGKFRDSSVDCFLLVEGKNDITAIEGITESSISSELISFSKHINAGRILVLPIGGTGSVALWEEGRLESFDKPVVFLRDRDDNPTAVASEDDIYKKINEREFVKVQHSRREMENLLSLNLIKEQMLQDEEINKLRFEAGLDEYGLTENNMDDCDVPKACARAYFYAQEDGELVPPDEKRLQAKESKVKKSLAKAFSRLDEESTQNLLESNFGALVRALNKALNQKVG